MQEPSIRRFPQRSLFSWMVITGSAPLAVLGLLLACPLVAEAQAPEIEWTRQFGSSAWDEGLGVTADASGIYMVGFTRGAFAKQSSAGGDDAFIRKFDVRGKELWTRQFGSSESDRASAASANAFGIYVAGDVAGTLPGQSSAGSQDGFVRKYDANGHELWTRQFGSSGVDEPRGISATDSGIYVAGLVGGTLPGEISAGQDDAFLRKYDSDGNEIWTRQFGTPAVDAALAVSADTSGIYIVGVTEGTLPGQASSGGFDAFIRKYDADGNEVWTRQFGTAVFDQAVGVTGDSSAVYVTGLTNAGLSGQTYFGSTDAFVRKYDADGNELWTQQFGTAVVDMAVGGSADASGIYVTGITNGSLLHPSAGDFDAFVRKYDLDGNEVWTHQFGSTDSDGATGIIAETSGVYVGGFTEGTLPGQRSVGDLDAFLVKIASLSPEQQLIHQLIAQLEALSLEKGVSNSLLAKLEAALRALGSSHDEQAIKHLQSFIAMVEIHRGKEISDAGADALITAAEVIIAQLVG